MFEKLKSFIHDDTFFISCLIMLVGVGSFGLGRLSVSEKSDKTENFSSIESITISPTPLVRSVLPGQTASVVKSSVKAEDDAEAKTATDNSGKFVASKSGTKYHRIDCPGAKQIKETNKIYFNSAVEAEAAGYAKASNCQNL